MPDNPNHSDSGAALLDDYIRGDAELAQALGKSEKTISRWAALRKLPPVTRLGKERLYHVDDVKEWLKRQRVKSEAR